MPPLKSFLVADFGHRYLKLAEFQISPNGGLTLKRCSRDPISLDNYSEENRGALVRKALQQKLALDRSRAGMDINICLPKLLQFFRNTRVRCQAKEIDRAVSDFIGTEYPGICASHHVLGINSSGEWEGLIAGALPKSVKTFLDAVASEGLICRLVDVPGAALYNAFRTSSEVKDGCTLIMDIGASSTNLVFMEGEKLYVREIGLGSHWATKAFAEKERMTFSESEEIVSQLGNRANIAEHHHAEFLKLWENLLNRLLIQSRATFGGFRHNYGNTTLRRIVLCGGGSLLPRTAEMASTRLEAPVVSWNPLDRVEIDPSIDRAKLDSMSAFMPGVVGLGLRSAGKCPVELNLWEPDQSLSQRIGVEVPKSESIKLPSPHEIKTGLRIF